MQSHGFKYEKFKLFIEPQNESLQTKNAFGPNTLSFYSVSCWEKDGKKGSSIIFRSIIFF